MSQFLKSCNKVTAKTIMASRSFYVQNARALEKLKSGEIPNEALQHGRYLIFHHESDAVLVQKSTRSIAWKSLKDLENEFKSETWASRTRVLLDVVEHNPEVCIFGVEVAGEFPETLQADLCHSRKALFLLNEKDSALVSQARGLLNFCRKTNFCKFCGKGLTLRPAGTQKTCDGCGVTHYPTLSPVGIVLIEDSSHSKILLVRGSRHPPGMFSCVAGFIEPGESLEGSIRREIAEEVGIDVSKVEYCASQHWAMPESQLMLGVFATALREDFEIDPVELEDGKWCDAATVRDALDRAKKQSAANMDPSILWVPPPTAVAHTLMEAWLTKYHGYVPSHL